MALQLGALRDALIEAGATTTKADRASEELAAFERSFSDLRTGLSDVSARVTMLTWAVGVQASLTLIVLGSTIALWSKLGEISGTLAQLAHTAH